MSADPTLDLEELLAAVGCEVPRPAIAGWDAVQRELAAAWAGAMMFREPDPPPRPAFLAEHDCRRCARCGCTDRDGCADGCSWPSKVAQVCSLCVSPRSLKQLVPFLERRPRVRIAPPRGEPFWAIFDCADEAGLWFHDDRRARHFLPVNCRLGRAAGHEAAVRFDTDGFALEKFNVISRVEYLRGPNE